MRCARILMVIALMLVAGDGFGHCDSLRGPVVAAARTAIRTGDATPVLRWVEPRYEGQIRDALARILRVRAKGSDAVALADQWFFETVVRLHRQGEGEKFVGLNDEPIEPALVLADQALTSGSAGALTKPLAGHVVSTIESAFAEVLERQKHADDSVDAGRRYVAAYVRLMHLVETIHAAGREDH